MVRFFGEHEPASAGKRIKTGFRERAKLEFAVAICEKCEHVKSQPIRRRFVERAENARVIGVSGTPRKQGLRFLAAIAPEVAVQQVHHGPKVAAFLDVYLENVSQ